MARRDALSGFVVGVNLPWLAYGCDFGANRWQPEGGVHRQGPRERLEGLFERLASVDARTVRWFLFCDGRAGMRFDGDGEPAGLDGTVVPDLEAALEAASRHRLKLLFVLFDFFWFRRRCVVDGVQLGGRRAVVADAARRTALLDRVVRPLLSRLGREPLVAGWDLLNEPEWATLGYGTLNPLTALWPATQRAFLGDMARLVRAEATQPVTVGLASARGLPLIRDCNLDFLQLHWYDRRERRSPLAHPCLDRLDRPVWLGEFPTAGSARGVSEVLEIARAAGYAGALAWSAAARDRYSDLDALERALRRG